MTYSLDMYLVLPTRCEVLFYSIGKRLPEALILRIFTDVCLAVSRLHHRTKPIIHRDLKVT